MANFVVGNGPLPDGNYRLKVLPSITDLVGNPLAGGAAYTQTFTVAGSVPPGGQVFEGSSNDTYTTATPLTISADPNNTGWYRSQVGYGSIDPSTDQDWWSFTAQAGDHVDVRSGVNGNTGFAPLIVLYQSNGASNPSALTSDGQSGPGNDAYISNYTIPTTGTYFVRVSRSSGTGTYDLRINLTRGVQLESDASYSNNNYNSANTLPFTTTGNAQHASIAGTIMGSEGNTTDLDDYQLGALNAGISITLGTRLPSWTTLEPQVRVYRLDGSNNRVYMTDTDPSDGGFSGTADANGNYYAEVYTTKAVLNGVRYTYNPTSQTWTAAEASAVTAGGHLASVPNQQTQDLLTSTFGQSGYWVGLNDAATEGTFAWSDGTPLTYTNWYQGSPVNNSANNDYVYFLTTGGLWYVTSNTDTHASVSQKPAEAGAPALSSAGVNAQYVLDVTVADTVPPVVSSVTTLPAQGQSTNQLLSSFAVNFSEKLATATVTAGAFDLRAAGPDGQFDTADDITYTLNLTYDSTNNVANFVVGNGPLPDGNYRLKVLPSITDLVGNPLAGGAAYTQTFTVAGSVPPGGQVFEGSSNDTYTTATPLTISADPNNTGWYRSQVGYGSIDPSTDQDWWSFTAQAGDHVDVRSGVNGNTGFAPLIVLYQSNGASNPSALTSDGQSGPGNDAYISNYTIPTTGTYFVRVSRSSGTGTYDLRINLTRGVQLESDASYSNNNYNSANTLPFTTTGNAQHASIAGTIMGSEGNTTDLDDYQLGALNAGISITLGTRLPSWTTLEPQVRVYRLDGSNNRVYMTDTDPSDGGFSGTADANGNYYAEVYTTKAVLNGQRYTFNANSVTWTAAEATAVTAGGHLASIPSQQVQSALVDTFGQSGYWVGLNDAATEGTFAWSDGTPLTYTNWYQGSPVNNSANNDYVYFLTTGGLWYVTSNTDTHASVSQKPAEAGAPALSSAGVNAQYVLDVTVADTVPPVVSSVTTLPAQGQSTNQLLSSFAVNFSEKLATATVTAGAFDLRTAGPDGQFDTADDITYTLNLTYDSTNNVANFVVGNGPLPDGNYRLKVLPSITDLVGNPLAGGAAYTQTFTVAGSVPPGGQVFEGSSNDTYTTATPLTISADPNNTGWYRSQVGYGSIDPSTDQDWWSFTAQAGDHVDVRSGVNGNTGFAPLIVLYQSNGASNPSALTSDGQSGPGNDAYISNYTIPTTGTYFVRVSRSSGTGTYDLRINLTRGVQLESDASYSNGGTGGANTVTFTTQGPSQVGAIAGTIMAGESGNVDKDYFNLGTIAAGQSVLLSVNLPTWSSLQPIVEVRNSSNQVISIDTSPTGGVARADITTSDVYYADVVAFSGQGLDGQYVLNVANQATSSLNFADLQVASITPPTGAVSGSPLAIGWTAGNFGAVPITNGTWTDRVYLSANSVFGDADDIPLGSVAQTRSLAVNETYAVTDNVTLPNGLGGNYFLFVQTDANNNIPEFIYESNNIRRSDNTFAITPAGPDLQIAGLSTTPVSPQSGQQVTVGWNDTNTGTASTPTGGNFVDHVTVVNTTTGQTLATQDVAYNAATSGVIAAGSSALRSFSFTLPDGNAGAGNLSITVTTNSQGNLFEYNSGGTASSNNTTTISATATLAPYPDLEVTNVAVTPPAPQSGHMVTVTWNDSNTGTGSATGSFTDDVIVVNSATNQVIADSTLTHNVASEGPIGAGGQLAAPVVLYPTGWSKRRRAVSDYSHD